MVRRQNKPTVDARNGSVVVLTRTAAVLKQQKPYGNHSGPLLVSQPGPVDIDGPEDLEYLEYLLTRRCAA